MEKIDNLDRQILEIISQNARIPFKDVAAECGVSRAANAYNALSIWELLSAQVTM